MYRAMSVAQLPMLWILAFGLPGCGPTPTQDDTSGPAAPAAAESGGGDSLSQPAPDTRDDRAENDRAESTTPADLAAAADTTSLTIGDPAPTLAIAKWVKGDPIDVFDPGQVYVVEFWATWCGPCRTSMPHISQLQNEYGQDVKFVGISDENEQVVQEFFDGVQDQEQGTTWHDAITYTIALDDADKNTGKAYMRAAQQNGIPTAFVVGRDGHVEWIGHPMQLDEPLAKIVAGDWDRAAALAKFESQKKVQEITRQLQLALRRARSTGDWSELRQIVAEAAAAGVAPDVVRSLRFDVAVLSSNYEEAHALADELATANWDNAQQLNGLAWNLVTRIPVESQDHDQALSHCATRQ